MANIIVGTAADLGPGPSRYVCVYHIGLDGALTLLHTLPSVPNPQFLAFSRSFLYTVTSEGSRPGTGALAAYAWDAASNTMAFINKEDTGGDTPVYVSIVPSGTHALVANYSGGSVAVLPLRPDGSIGPASDIKHHTGETLPTLQDRQEGPHPHSIRMDPYVQKWVLVPDLGLDVLYVYEWLPERGALAGGNSSPRNFQFARGSGPRLLAFHPEMPVVYVVHELTAVVSVVKLDLQSGQLALLQDVPVLPDDVPAMRANNRGSADIHVAPSGRELFVSSRTDMAIAVFGIDSHGYLTLLTRAPSGGDLPRSLMLTADGVIVANQGSRALAVLARAGDGLVLRHTVAVPGEPTFVHLL